MYGGVFSSGMGFVGSLLGIILRCRMGRFVGIVGG